MSFMLPGVLGVLYTASFCHQSVWDMHKLHAFLHVKSSYFYCSVALLDDDAPRSLFLWSRNCPLKSPLLQTLKGPLP